MTSIKPFLILQLRPEDETADDELGAFIRLGGLTPDQVQRIRLDRESLPAINLEDYSGIIVGGGPSNISDSNDKKSGPQKRFETELFNLLDKVAAVDLPFLGACYGLGLLARYLGGEVSKERYYEDVGAVTINLTKDAQSDPLTKTLKPSFRAFGGHKEACQNLPPGASLLASSETCPVQMIRYKKNIYATQFHTELDKAGLALRINIYRHAGYFPPEDAEKLIVAVEPEQITEPEKILRQFVTAYSRPA